MTNRLLPYALMILPLAASAKPNPKLRPDGAWVSLSGTAVQTASNHFTLDYGSGTILVEMDDWDNWGDARNLVDGDPVTVHGRIDADVFERHKIEASSVYVKSLGSTFYANPADEEGAPWVIASPSDPKEATLWGTITEVDQAEREFKVDIGTQKITVETERLTWNPLDDTGYQQLDVGDVVSVHGEVDRDFMEGRVFDALDIVTLIDEGNDRDKRKKKRGS